MYYFCFIFLLFYYFIILLFYCFFIVNLNIKNILKIGNSKLIMVDLTNSEIISSSRNSRSSKMLVYYSIPFKFTLTKYIKIHF